MAKKRLTVGIDCRMLGWGGIGRYTRGLIYGLQQIDVPHDFVLIAHPEFQSQISKTENFKLVTNSHPVFSVTNAVSFSSFVNRLKIDLFHSPHFIYPWFYQGPGVATIHDLIPVKYPKTISAVNRLKFMMALKLTVKKAGGIIAVSNSTKNDLTGIFDIPEKKIKVTYEAVDKNFYPRESGCINGVREKFGLDGDYMVYVGAYKPHKNICGIIRAYNLLPLRLKEACALVLAGRRDSRYRVVDDLIDRFGIRDRVIQIEEISDEDLAAVYSGAKAMVFPSFYEGFGLPPLEAMACNVPVLTSNTSSLGEMYEGKALTVDPENDKEIAGGIESLLSDQKLREDYIKKGAEHVRQFSWDKMAEQTVGVYEAAAGL